MAFQEIQTTGSNYEIGFTHGAAAPDKVAGTIYYYKQKFEKIWNCSWENIKQFSNQYYQVIQELFPQYIQEMEGIAAGSGQSFEDILAINCHYEIARKGGLMESSCSVVGISAERSADGKAYIAENWDYAVFQKGNTVLLKIALPNGTKLCMVTEAGIIGRMGFNNHGIGYCGNTLKNDYVGPKLPLHMIKRLVLEQTSLEDARRIIHNYGAGSSFNMLLCSATEDPCDFEIDYRQVTELSASNGLLFHTNHFTSADLIRQPAYTKYQKQESVLRLNSLRKSLEHLDKISMENLIHTLRTHDNHPQGVCTHANASAPLLEQWSTICSMIVDLSEQTMYVCEGNPCENEYVKVII